MSRNDEKTLLKMNLLGGMNEYIRVFCSNDDIINSWLNWFPDECDEEELKKIAEDENAFVDIVRQFDRCCRCM